jgi:predicted dehydrogenase
VTGVDGTGHSEAPGLRLGVLGAARITELSLVAPARTTGARLLAVAARDRGRAEAFAAAHGVERVYDDYAGVLADPDVEAVYNPLANALHGPLNLATIAAGKHVLGEKPFASNAVEAQEVADAARVAGVTAMEAFHYLFHPVMRRMLDVLRREEVGELRHVEAVVDIPPPPPSDPRWSLGLAGGALMDLGCYGLHAHRWLASTCELPEPRVERALVVERSGAPGVDQWFDVELGLGPHATGRVRCDMAAARQEMTLRVVGTRGEASAASFVLPHLDDRVVVTTPAGTSVEQLGRRSSYTFQLEAFTAAVRQEVAPLLDTHDAVRTMRLVDDCYRAAGLAPRSTVSTLSTAREPWRDQPSTRVTSKL